MFNKKTQTDQNQNLNEAILVCDYIEYWQELCDTHQEMIELGFQLLVMIVLLAYFWLAVYYVFIVTKWTIDELVNSIMNLYSRLNRDMKIKPSRFHDYWSIDTIETWLKCFDDFIRDQPNQKANKLKNLLDQSTLKILSPYIQISCNLPDQQQYDLLKEVILVIAKVREEK